jgi:hypothetical protein
LVPAVLCRWGPQSRRGTTEPRSRRKPTWNCDMIPLQNETWHQAFNNGRSRQRGLCFCLPRIAAGFRNGQTRLGMRSDGEDTAEPPARPFSGAHDMGSNHQSRCRCIIRVDAMICRQGPQPWLGNAGGASVSQGLRLIRTSVMYLQGFWRPAGQAGQVDKHSLAS